ncbi:MAG: ABC transporter ATP-binding protein/permease [Dehalococcoidia bacterium]|nr:ABC transporter ATP-binding protein/permease [Dehalococcoidia bacterium]
MLKVKSLTIAYCGRTIFENVNVEFKRGTITVIQGRSGSGKSSFLNVIGLMQTAKNHEYIFDDQIISNFNEAKRADFRLHNIGFVFQQSNLIQELTVRDNLIVPMSITEQDNIEQKADELLQYVGLESVKHCFPCSLSGGEEQRLAIARAIANDADIILADEPTASLDADNSKLVLELFSRLAHDLNKIVILVSHSEFVPKYADVICEIVNKNLVITSKTDPKKADTISPLAQKTKKRKPLRFIRFYSQKRRSEKVLDRVFVMVTALVAAAAILAVNFGANYVQAADWREQISDKSIFVVNNSMHQPGKTGEFDYEDALALTPAQIDQISSIPGVTKVYPWYSFLSFSGSGVSSDITQIASINIAGLPKPIEYENSLTNSDKPRERFSVYPVFDEDINNLTKYPDGIYSESGQTGMILSLTLAKKLASDPSDLINKAIEINCFVPTKLKESSVSVQTLNFTIDKAYYKLVTIESTITGILPGDYDYKRTNENNYILMNETDFDAYIKGSMIPEKELEEDEKLLAPSALIVIAESYDMVESVADQIKLISPEYSAVVNLKPNTDYGDSLRVARVALTIVTITFIAIVMVMFCLLYHLRNRTRKKEFGILKAIGFTSGNIISLTSLEMLNIAIPSFLISLVMAFLILLAGNGLSNNTLFTISFFSVFVGLIVCIAVVVAAGMFPVYNAIKVDPIKAIQCISK